MRFRNAAQAMLANSGGGFGMQPQLSFTMSSGRLPDVYASGTIPTGSTGVGQFSQPAQAGMQSNVGAYGPPPAVATMGGMGGFGSSNSHNMPGNMAGNMGSNMMGNNMMGNNNNMVGSNRMGSNMMGSNMMGSNMGAGGDGGMGSGGGVVAAVPQQPSEESQRELALQRARQNARAMAEATRRRMAQRQTAGAIRATGHPSGVRTQRHASSHVSHASAARRRIKQHGSRRHSSHRFSTEDSDSGYDSYDSEEEEERRRRRHRRRRRRRRRRSSSEDSYSDSEDDDRHRRSRHRSEDMRRHSSRRSVKRHSSRAELRTHASMRRHQSRSMNKRMSRQTSRMRRQPSRGGRLRPKQSLWQIMKGLGNKKPRPPTPPSNYKRAKGT